MVGMPLHRLKKLRVNYSKEHC